MQGLWSTHRRNKVNLNTDVHPATIPVEPPAENTVAVTDSKPSSVNGKRKLRSSRIMDESSKRQKMASSKDYSPPSTRLADLGGVDACIEKMLEYIAMPLCHPEIYLHTGIQPPRGVLLHGPPGCGKTMVANAMAGVRILYICTIFFLC